MCNLYSLTKGQEAIRRLFGVERDLTGNLPPLPGIYPDYSAPVVREGEADASCGCQSRRIRKARR